MSKDFIPIKDYYIIGDLHTCALISKSGSIDWMCIPQFDSPSIFGKLLDPDAGHFSIAPQDFQIESMYTKDTAILEFSFKNNESSFSLKDFMIPIETDQVKRQLLIRKFKGIKGSSTINLDFFPKLNYGSENPQIDAYEDRLEFHAGSQKIALFLPEKTKLANNENGFRITFRVTPLIAMLIFLFGFSFSIR